MEKIGAALTPLVLRSGGAHGADAIFAAGHVGTQEIMLAQYWSDEHGTPVEYEEEAAATARAIAREVHPAYDSLNDYAKRLHARNVMQVLGPTLTNPSRFLVCWTPEGKLVGGTATAIKVARLFGVPVFNLASRDWTARWILRSAARKRQRVRLVNVREEPCEVYVGREGKGQPGYFGNPMRRADWGDDTLPAWEAHFWKRMHGDPEYRARVVALRGRLGCFCYPAPCHAEVYERFLNGKVAFSPERAKIERALRQTASPDPRGPGLA